MRKDRIKQRRKELGLTQPALAKVVGVTKAAVSQWENGDTALSGSNLLKLAKALSVEPEWLESGDGLQHAGVNKGRNLDQLISEYPTLSLFDRKNLALKLKGETHQVLKTVSSIAIPEDLYSDNVFAMVEDMPGLKPMIYEGDRVYIKPGLDIKAGVNSMFWVNGIPIVGVVSMSPAGIQLRFIADGPGWEPAMVTEKQHIGRVIAIEPLWAIEQRED
ncbi:MAG: helix-turn-helix domain-containing protein [Cycloclasticus sp.]|jgi:Predicted transcriptional regulators